MMTPSPSQPRCPLRALAVFIALAAAVAGASADGLRGAGPMPQAYVQECGSCHVPFLPALLGAASWQRLMANLARHYGTDASLDAANVATISAWLASSAGRGRRVAEAPPEDRITRSAWFRHEHDDVGAAAWQRPSIKSAANCAACHPRAERGVFDEHEIRIPR